jgi:tyrosyl-tRNA synthetase
VELLVASRNVPSKRQAREDIMNGAISIMERKCRIYVPGEDDKNEGQFTVIRRGKKKYFLIKY